jgi:predicted RNase H-like HicB family nuclease
MPNTYTAITKKVDSWWIGWVEEMPGVNCQEKTREELLASLRTTLSEMIQFNREDAIKAASPGYTEEPLTV